jgi:hypothetical protein
MRQVQETERKSSALSFADLLKKIRADLTQCTHLDDNDQWQMSGDLKERYVESNG